MGKSKKEEKAAAAVASSSGGRSWFPSSRTRKKYLRCLLWLVIPLSISAAVAFLAPPPPPEAPEAGARRTAAAAADDAIEMESGGSAEAPPSDSWAKPEECMAWAGSGQCKANPGFMRVNCAFSCAKLVWAKARYDKRCPKPEGHVAALAPGQMQKTFARAMSDFPELEPELISEDPPVILFHKFLSEAEVRAGARTHWIGHVPHPSWAHNCAV